MPTTSPGRAPDVEPGDAHGAAYAGELDQWGVEARMTAADAASVAGGSGELIVGSRWRPAPVTLAAFLLGVAATAVLFGVSLSVYNRNESRLLKLRVRELGLVLSDAQSSTQTPLQSAAELADATAGSPTKFRAFVTPYVGVGRPFSSVSLWPVGVGVTKPAVVVGESPLLGSDPARVEALFSRALRTKLVSIAGVLRGSGGLRLGYAFESASANGTYAVYAENPLPKDRRSRLASNTGFTNLNYAIYLGQSRSAPNLLVTNISSFPIRGRQASESIPYGSTALTLVVTPDGSLGGTYFERLPLAIAVLGLVLTLAAAAMTDRLARRRRRAEHLVAALDDVASENRRMYTEQRGIAQTLQHALLPDALPVFAGLETSVRYLPADADIDIGGDWYDVVEVDGGRVLVLVGDVSGHGLPAATTMASLRYAARAYATEQYGPGDLLAKLSDFVGRSEHDYFATVLCGLIDVDAHTLTLASAGHLAPLLIDGKRAEFVELDPGVPIGVERTEPYGEVVVSVPAKATLIAFTDGLVERRGEMLDAGLARLQAAATARSRGLDELVAALGRDLASEGPQDDTAILGIRWIR
jgi:serine phosphatase RsbU (regulator of sigma subunit)/type II secretory pathway pseudopilin PulG